MLSDNDYLLNSLLKKKSSNTFSGICTIQKHTPSSSCGPAVGSQWSERSHGMLFLQGGVRQKSSRERQWLPRGLRMFLFARVHHSHQFPTTSEEQCLNEGVPDVVWSESIYGVFPSLPVGNLCRTSITATGVEAHKQIRLEKISLLIRDKGHLTSISCAWEKLLSPPAEPAPTKQIIKSSVSDFLVVRQTKEASWVERNHILLLCGVAANKGRFSAEKEPCWAK